MILSFWKYIHGYVIIKIYGYAPERFMNLCANRNIYLWNIGKVSDGYIFSISVKGFFMLRPIAKKTRCKVKIMKKVGLPFRFFFFRARKFFLIGFFLSVSIVIFLSFFVWKIEIDGNSEYTSVEIIDYLERNQIQIGVFKPNIDCSLIDDQLLLHFDNMIWVSSELKGTNLIIHIREGVKGEKMEILTEPSDMIATKAGTIVSIITRTGTPLVKQGDQVEKGDVLVSGTLEIKELDQLKAVEFTASDADIYLKTTYPYKNELSIDYIEKVYIEKKTKKDYALNILDYKINLFKPSIKDGLYDKISTSVQLELINNFYLPVEFDTTTYKGFYEIEKQYTKEEGKKKLELALNRYLQLLEENNIQIIKNGVKFKTDGQKYIAEGDLIVIEKTGDREPFNEMMRRQEYNEFFTEEDGDTP